MTALALNPLVVNPSDSRTSNVASALKLGLKAGLGIALLVLLVHAVVLWWVRGELQTSGFKSTERILYSRLIVPAPEPIAAPIVPAPAPTIAPRPVPKPKPVQTKAITLPTPEVAPAPPPDEPPPRVLKEEPPPEAVVNKIPDTQTGTPDIATDNHHNQNAPNASMPAGEPIPWPPTTRISYDLSGNYRGDLHGSGAFEWVRDKESGYQLSLRVKSLVGIEYRSRGSFDNSALKPIRYEEQLPRGVTAVSFDHVTNKVSFSRITDVVDMAPEMQDRASAIMQLVHLITANPRQLPALMDKGERIKLAVANPTGTDTWEFEVKGKEEVKTGESGTLKAWHLQRVPRKPNGDLGVDLWLSEQLQGMPVRIKLTLSADTFLDLVMTKAEQ
jgi:Protein of unknown function (DUF3108)